MTCSSSPKEEQVILFEESRIVYTIVNPKTERLRFYWKEDSKHLFRSLGKLKRHLESKGRKLTFAINGGMFDKYRNPVGLYVEKGVVKKKLNKNKVGYGNFYLNPNGVFYLEKQGTVHIVKTDDFEPHPDIDYATQSGPMLVIDGQLNPLFNNNSENLHIRNGVGILPNGSLLFAISREKINFYDFASFFKKNACKDALYLDGFVSRAYMPQQNWHQLDGDFGVIIGVDK